MAVDDGYPQIIMSGTDPNLPAQILNGYGKYSQFKPMARGGKGELFSAWDNVMGRPVAIKTLKPELADNDYERRRFLREARVTAQLQHPNTVPVYEVGRADDGSLYFTMKRLMGEDLYAVVVGLQKKDAGTIEAYPLERLLSIVIQACQALAYAHSHGVIHRDVKPENIWIGRFAEVVLLDWGVAKVWGLPDEPAPQKQDSDSGQTYHERETDDFDPENAATLGIKQNDTNAPSLAENMAEADQSDAGQSIAEQQDDDIPQVHDRLKTLTRSGVRPGTPLYMSPEQVDGQRYVDERTDIFSIGVVLYELLTLQLPFYGATVNATFQKILKDNPKRPKHKAPFRDIPDSMEKIVMKALQKKPADRYQSMQELLEEIRLARRSMLLKTPS